MPALRCAGVFACAMVLLALACGMAGCSQAGGASAAGGAAASATQAGTQTAAPAGEAATEAEAASAQAAVEAVLQGFASQDASVLKATLGGIGFTPEDYGVTWKVFAQTCYQGFSYAVTGTEPRKDSNSGVGVSIRVEVPPMESIIPALYQTSKSALDAGANAKKAGYANAAWKKAWGKAGFSNNKLEATFYVSPDESGTWQIEDTGAFAALLMDGYDPRQQ